MKLALWKLKTGSDWAGDPDRVHREFPTFPIKPEELAAPEGYFSFTIVRDPVKRLLSSYGNRVHFHRDLYKAVPKHRGQRWVWRLRHRGVDLLPDADKYFSDLKLYQSLSHSIWHHTAGVRTFIGDDLSRFDRIYKIEEIDRLEKELSAHTRTRVVLPREQTSGPKLEYSDLSLDARKAVKKSTEEDYDFLAEYFQPPN